jgi:hypothetical protein
MTKLSDEIWLAAKIKAAGVKWGAFEGVTTIEQRKERVREAIIRNGLAGGQCGKKDGQPQSFGTVFAWVYGEALHREEAA